MWVQRTADEVRQVRHAQRKQRVHGAAVFGGFVAILVTVMYGWGEWTTSRSLLVALSDMPGRIPFAILAATLSGGVFYLTCPRQSQNTAVVCPHCESSQNGVAGTVCSCGGRLEWMDDMKWIDVEPRAPSNGGPAMQLGNSGVAEGPPSVS